MENSWNTEEGEEEKWKTRKHEKGEVVKEREKERWKARTSRVSHRLHLRPVHVLVPGPDKHDHKNKSKSTQQNASRTNLSPRCSSPLPNNSWRNNPNYNPNNSNPDSMRLSAVSSTPAVAAGAVAAGSSSRTGTAPWEEEEEKCHDLGSHSPFFSFTHNTTSRYRSYPGS
jgi:hypothetical protein